MLFVSDDEGGKGLGRELLAYGEMFANPVTPTPELVNIIRPFFTLRI